jgi:hypothetical protein
MFETFSNERKKVSSPSIRLLLYTRDLENVKGKKREDKLVLFLLLLFFFSKCQIVNDKYLRV